MQADKSGDQAMYGSSFTRREILTVKLRFLSLRGACSVNLPSIPLTVEIVGGTESVLCYGLDDRRVPRCRVARTWRIMRRIQASDLRSKRGVVLQCGAPACFPVSQGEDSNDPGQQRQLLIRRNWIDWRSTRFASYRLTPCKRRTAATPGCRAYGLCDLDTVSPA